MARARHGPPRGEVHVWAVPEPSDGAALERCLGLLSPDELRRWRHVVPSQRALYASAHAALRAVAGAYAGCEPSQVAFTTGKFGKPYVPRVPGLRVSLAHTSGLSLVAVSRDGPVGVDVERITPLRDPAGLRRQVLSDWEAARWPVIREDPLHTGLFTHWTCKEAILKALGSGLAGDLTAVRVAPAARRSGPVRVHAAPGSPKRRWALQLIDVGEEFRAAVAVAGGGDVVRVFTLTAGGRPMPARGLDTGVASAAPQARALGADVAGGGPGDHGPSRPPSTPKRSAPQSAPPHPSAPRATPTQPSAPPSVTPRTATDPSLTKEIPSCS